MKFLRNLLSGFLMGSADLVPGVSGGTIALVLGIYQRLVASVREASSGIGSTLRGNWSAAGSRFRSVEWPFVLTLLAGILTAVVLLSALLDRLLEERPIVMAAFFFGLVVGSVFIAWRLLERPGFLHAGVAVIVGATLFAILGLGDTANEVDGQSSFLVLFGAGALAICAMILPGISGSLILLMIGKYTEVLDAVSNRELGKVAAVGIGAITGLAVFSQILHWALSKHHDVMLAALVGLMAGSLRVLWPWPGGVESSALGAVGSEWAMAMFWAVVGSVLVYGISKMAVVGNGSTSSS